jgi:4-amino-4-deoxy-L-arabinose transferase-like glycosyltransferase
MRLSRSQKIAFWTILFLHLCLLLVFVFFRLIDYDEGSYLSAARLVREGNLPYIDFFYPQMPLLPYAYSSVSHLGFPSIYWGRLISALTGLLLSIAVFRFLLEFSREAKVSLFLFFLYCLNGLTVNWHSVVKTLVFSDLFAFLSFFCFAFYVLRGADKAHLRIFLSGVFIGLAFNFRLIFILLLVIQGLLILFLSTTTDSKSKIYHLLTLCFGAILPSLPAVYLLLREPLSFVFGNVGYHLVWGNLVIKMKLMTKLFTLSKFLLYPQNLLILSAAALGVSGLLRKQKYRKHLDSRDKVILSAGAYALALIMICFFMSPTQFQYYEQALPYLLIFSVPAWQKLEARFRERRMLTRVIVGTYLALVIPFAVIFLCAFREKDQSFRIGLVRNVVEVIQQNSQPDDMVLCGWPAYAVLSGRKSVPGLETWGWEVAPYLSQQQVAQFHVIDSLGLEKLIRKKEAGLIVQADWFPPKYGGLIQENYSLVGSAPFADIYVVKQDQ